MKITSFVVAACACIFLLSCSKHSAVDTDPVQPTIILTLPANTQVYSSGESVRIKGTVSDNSLHELRMKITDNATSATLYSVIISVHDLTSYDFDQSWKSNVTVGTDATVQVEAEDHGNHTTEKKVTIRINPL